MTDLNTIAHLSTPGFDLGLAEGINARGEIVGNAVDNNPSSPFFGYFLAFSALPCNTTPLTEEGCREPAHGTSATAGSAALIPHIALTPNRGWRRLGSFAGLP